jgi:8-oxo-dGTP diphosphatase
MKDRKDRPPILAAGGIVLRGERKPRIAVVQLRKMDAWVLPKGKLAAGEDMLAAARREVLEETGHRVAVHEFLGTLAYEVSGRPKVVQFWRMQALGGPVGGLMRDVRAVDWLALDAALDRLTHPREHAFLTQVGPLALAAAERTSRRPRLLERAAPVARPAAATPWFAPVDHAVPAPVDCAPIIERIPTIVPAAAPPGDDTAIDEAIEGAIETADQGMLERTWQWLRQVAQAQRRA